MLSGFGSSLSIIETTSDNEDAGGEPGAILNNGASGRINALRLAVEGSRRDRGILAANLTAPWTTNYQEIMSIGDEGGFKFGVEGADRYLIRGLAWLADDTTNRYGPMGNPATLGTHLLPFTRHTAGMNVLTAPQGVTRDDDGSSFDLMTRINADGRIRSILSRAFGPPNPAVLDTPTAPGVTLGVSGGDISLPNAPYMAVLGELLHEMVSNFGQTDGGYVTIGPATVKVVSQGFTTGSYPIGYRFEGIGVNIEGSGSNVPDGPASVSVTVHEADANGKPGAKLFDLVSPGHYAAGHSFFEAPQGRGTVLESNTSYVMVWSHVSGTNHRLRRTKVNGEDSGKLTGFSIADAYYFGSDVEDVNQLAVSSTGNSLEIAVYGEAITVEPAPSVVAGEPHVSAGGYHSCSLDAEGDIECVGRNDEAQVSPLPALGTEDTWAMVSAGEFHTCGLVSTGGIKCWGDDGFDQVTDTPTDTDFVALDAGPWHTCALKGDDTFTCWGRNDDGQLVDGTEPERGNKPEADFGKIDWITKPFDAATVVMVSAGGSVFGARREADTSHSYTCVLWSTGNIGCAGHTPYGWDERWHGIEPYGGTGVSPKFSCTGGDLTTYCPTPDPRRYWALNVPELDVGTGYTSVSVGGKHACATVNDGSIRCWGREHDGALGSPQTQNGDLISPKYGTKTSMAYGTPPPTSDGWISVSAGHYHSCATANSANSNITEIICWGNEIYFDSISENYPKSEINPGSSPAADNARLPSSGGWHTCWIHGPEAEPSVSCKGDQDFGQSQWENTSLLGSQLQTSSQKSTGSGSIALQAEFQDLPMGHDGSTAFTVDIVFSEEVDLSYKTLEFHAFTVTGGSVTSASRLDKPSNMRWRITVEPDSNAAVTIVLPPTTDCADQGAICTEGDKPLSVGLAFQVPGLAEGAEADQNEPATGAPTIGGAPQVGETLTASISDIADADGLERASFGYWWLRVDGQTETLIEEASGTSYTLKETDQGKTIRVRVKFNDDEGNEETLTSAATAEVAAKPNSPATGEPTIGGTAQVGETLTADTSGIADDDGLNEAIFSYHWVRYDGSTDTEIAEASGSSYTLGAADLGKSIKVRVDFTDDSGHQESLTSLPVGPVDQQVSPQQTNSPATGAPTITGTAQVGETLTASTSGIADEDGLADAVFTYQWIRNNGGIDAAITGATSGSYTLVSADEGKTIKVKVSFADDRGHEETLTSAPTETVGASGSHDRPYRLQATAAEAAITLTWQHPDTHASHGLYHILRHRPELGEARPLV